MFGEFEVVPRNTLMNIPIGSVIEVGKKLIKNSHWSEAKEPSYWYVFTEGKAFHMSNDRAKGETEDLDWFSPWLVRIIHKG